MAPRIARRAALTAASVTIAATGLLTTGSPASAAAHPTDSRTTIASHHLQLPDTHDDSHNRDTGQAHNDDNARRRWITDQIKWTLHHNPTTQHTNDDDTRRRWITDQIEWTPHHNPTTQHTNDGNNR